MRWKYEKCIVDCCPALEFFLVAYPHFFVVYPSGKLRLAGKKLQNARNIVQYQVIRKYIQFYFHAILGET